MTNINVVVLFVLALFVVYTMYLFAGHIAYWIGFLISYVFTRYYRYRHFKNTERYRREL